jgi:hypothetical protein
MRHVARRAAGDAAAAAKAATRAAAEAAAMAYDEHRRANKFPIVRLRGTHREIGLQHGRLLKGRVGAARACVRVCVRCTQRVECCVQRSAVRAVQWAVQ